MDDDAFSLQPEGIIKGSAQFDPHHDCRLELRRWWVEEPLRWVAWLLQNPSDAGADRNDPTIFRIIHFSRAWGYDGAIVVNLWPFIASRPADLWRWTNWESRGPDWYARDAMMFNEDYVEEAGRAACLRTLAATTSANVTGTALPSWRMVSDHEP